MPTKKKRANPRAGAEFERKYRSKVYKLKVVRVDGKTAYQLGDAAFSSPSAAAKSLTHHEVNGWTFWKMD